MRSQVAVRERERERESCLSSGERGAAVDAAKHRRLAFGADALPVAAAQPAIDVLSPRAHYAHTRQWRPR